MGVWQVISEGCCACTPSMLSPSESCSSSAWRSGGRHRVVDGQIAKLLPKKKFRVGVKGQVLIEQIVESRLDKSKLDESGL